MFRILISHFDQVLHITTLFWILEIADRICCIHDADIPTLVHKKKGGFCWDSKWKPLSGPIVPPDFSPAKNTKFMHVRSQKPAVKLHNFFGIICKYVNHNLNNFNIQDGGQNKKQSNIVTEHLQLHTNPFNGNIQRKMPNFIIIYEYNFTLAHENREMQKDCINFNHSMTNGR